MSKKPSKPRHLLHEPRFRRVVFARAISAFGNHLSPIALAFGVLGMAGGSATSLGLVLAANEVSSVVMLLWGGVWGDRISRSKLMAATCVVQAAGQAGCAALLLRGAATVSELAILQATVGAASGLYTPASRGILPEVVDAAKLRPANAFIGLSTSIVGIAAPALGGVLVGLGSPGTALALDAVTFLVSGALFASLRLQPSARDHCGVLAEMAAGWGEFRGRQWVWRSVISFALFNLFSFTPWFVLGAVIAKGQDGGATAWGIVLGVGGMGLVAGGLVALRLSPARPLVAGQIGSALWVVQLVALAVGPGLPVLAGAAFLGGAGISLSGIYWFSALQAYVPRDVLARVSSYDEVGSFIATPISYVAIGPVAASIGVHASIWVGVGGSSIAIAVALTCAEVRSLGTAAMSAPRPIAFESES